MSAALPLTVNMQSLLASKSKGRVVKGIEPTWCRASKSAWGDGKFAATKAATPLQYASAGDSPPSTYTYKLYIVGCCSNSKTKYTYSSHEYKLLLPGIYFGAKVQLVRTVRRVS